MRGIIFGRPAARPTASHRKGGPESAVGHAYAAVGSRRRSLPALCASLGACLAPGAWLSLLQVGVLCRGLRVYMHVLLGKERLYSNERLLILATTCLVKPTVLHNCRKSRAASDTGTCRRRDANAPRTRCSAATGHRPDTHRSPTPCGSRGCLPRRRCASASRPRRARCPQRRQKLTRRRCSR